MADPFNVFAIDDIRLITGFDIEPVVPLDLNSMDTLDFSRFANYRANYLPTPAPIVSAPAETHKEITPTEGTMVVSGKKDTVLPLKFTEVRADITGMLAEVKVSQKFYNDLEENIEAVYMFPLPHESAVLDFEVITGDKVIKSVIKERGEAKKTYEKARQEMKKAALLEQDKEDLFTISVANIEPGQTVLVNIRYYETIKYEEGEYEFVFPMTATPRYVGKDGGGVPERMEGKSFPSVIPAEKSGGREINIFINLEAGFEIGSISSPTHNLFIQEKGKSRREIQLAREGEIPNKDFVLKYSSTGEKEETILSFYREEGKAGTFMLHITPKMDYGPEEMIRREIIFVLDRSGSMGGTPMEQAKRALKDCLRALRGGDAFSVITFDTEIECLSERPMEFNEENLKKADKFIEATFARGGTEILSSLKKAFKMPAGKDHLRQIVFLTDGAIADVESSIEEITRNLGNSRIFTFGIGCGVNRHFLEKIAQTGRGTCQFISNPVQIREAIEKFTVETSCPVLSDINLEWEGAAVSDILPEPVPDIYFGKVLYLLGRFHSEGKVKAILSGNTGKGTFRQEIPVELPAKDITYPVIETIWAKKHIDFLLEKTKEEPKKKQELRDEIIGVAMKYNLVTPYTSLVAVEKDAEEREKKDIVKIDVPGILPEGLNYNYQPAPAMHRTPVPPPAGNYEATGSEDSILRAINKQFGVTDLAEVQETVQDIALSDFGDLETLEEDEDMELDKLKEVADEAPIVRVVNLIITQAIHDMASDIHIEPGAKNVCVRYRIDGVLHEVMAPPKHIQVPIATRIKTMAGLDIDERKIPQKGKMHLKHDNREYDFRVSTLPTIHGEKIVMHILDREAIITDPGKLGFLTETKTIFEELLSGSRGMFLITGPAGSGKSTTLYTAINMLKSPEKNICTVEDSVKCQMAGVNQVQINRKAGLTFPSALKSFLYQDPDIIMVDGIHDLETAQIAMEYALNGLVLGSFLNSGDAPGIITGIIDMGIEPFPVASGLVGCIAQRLVRRICPDCRESYNPPEEAVKELGLNPADTGTVFYHGRGCVHCKGTGYKGRCGIYEIMPVNEAIQTLILKKASSSEIREEAIKKGMITMKQDCLNKILDGTTTIEEYFRVMKK